MSNLKDIRRQLRSVENIKKITDTMERIALARLRSAQEKAEQSKPYLTKLKEILEHLLADSKPSHPLFEKRAAKRIGVVVVSADRGLSGSYNTNIFQASDRFLKKFNPDQIELILLGRKSIEYYKKRPWKIRDQIERWSEKSTFEVISKFTDKLIHWFSSKELDEVWLIYTQYISMMRRNVVVEKFLNIGNMDTSQTKTVNYILEPDLEAILKQILPRYCSSRIQAVLHESYAAELAARVIAMQTASKNSEEMIINLTLTKNKIRQTDITREMLEITGGAEGLK